MKGVKKIVSILAVMLAMCTMHIAANAQTLTSVDFSGIEAGTVEDITTVEGISVSGAAGYEIVDGDGSNAPEKYLKVTNSTTTTAKITFPFIEANQFEFSDDEKLVVEYDVAVLSPIKNLQTIGTVGVIAPFVREGGLSSSVIGFSWRIGATSGSDYNQFGWYVAPNGDVESYWNDNGPWIKVCFEIDSTNGNADVTVKDYDSNRNILTCTRSITGKTLTDLIFNVSGKEWSNSSAGTSGTSTGTLGIANVNIYTLPKLKMVSSTPEDGEEGVYETSTTVKAVFSEAVDAATLSNVKVMQTGTLVSSGYSVALDPEDTTNKTVVVTFDSLDKATAYKVDFAGITSVGTHPQALTGETVINFSTEANESVMITAVNFVEGSGSSAVSGTGLSASKLNGIAVDLVNNDSKTNDVTVIYAVYDASGRLVDFVISGTELAANEELTLTTAMTIPAEGFVKVFTWEGMTSLKPWSAAVVNNIN